jgi:predicted O-methyltransferase YrrM
VSTNLGITALRRGVKRLVRQTGFRWLATPARQGWYYLRTAGDLANVPTFLTNFNRDTRSRPIDELVELVFSGYGNMFRPFQNGRELRRFIERAAALKPRTVVEIGTARGGTLFLLSCIADPSARLVSVDLPAGLYGGGYPSWKGLLYRRFMGAGQSLHLIRGDSHKQTTFEQTLEALNGDSVDLLFIDGDHTYAGAKQDFMKYRSLVRPGGLIVFHDILPSAIDKDITVSPLWAEVAGAFRTEEIVDSYDQGQFGIGVLIAPDEWEMVQVAK